MSFGSRALSAFLRGDFAATPRIGSGRGRARIDLVSRAPWTAPPARHSRRGLPPPPRGWHRRVESPFEGSLRPLARYGRMRGWNAWAPFLLSAQRASLRSALSGLAAALLRAPRRPRTCAQRESSRVAGAAPAPHAQPALGAAYPGRPHRVRPRPWLRLAADAALLSRRLEGRLAGRGASARAAAAGPAFAAVGWGGTASQRAFSKPMPSKTASFYKTEFHNTNAEIRELLGPRRPGSGMSISASSRHADAINRV